MRRAALGGAALVLISTSLARAQEEDAPRPSSDGVYLTVGGSLGAVNDPRTTDDFEVDLGIEFGLFVGVGYDLGPVRIEGQLLTETFQVDNLVQGPTTTLPPGNYDGVLNSVGLMADAFVDIDRWDSYRPYLGVGGGFIYMWPDYRDNSCIFFFCTGGESAVDGNDTVRAWQVMAGLTVPARQAAGEWGFGYRHLSTGSADFRVDGGARFTQEGIRSHSFQIGYRHYFGATAE